MDPRVEKIMKAAEYIAARLDGKKPFAGIVLGSGLGKLADKIENPTVIPYKEIPGFPVSTAVGHKGNFIAGELGHWRPNVAAFNEMIHHISEYIPNSDWVSSKRCSPISTPDPDGKPNLKDPHFDRKSQIIIGKRYADKVYKLIRKSR